jgi:hypothetical protein
MKRLAIFITLLGCFSGAYAANWVQLPGGSDGVASYDTSSIEVSGHLVRVWVDYEEPKSTVVNPNSPATAETRTRLIINCRKHTVALGESVRYDAAGEILDSQQGLPGVFWAPVPDTASEKVASLICKG